MSDPQPAEVVVIGAGPGGLAAAAMLRRAGLGTLVADRADAVGSAWRGHYERLHLHTHRVLSGLPGLAIPRRYGPWVSRADVVSYLESYAAHHRLDIRFGTAVERVDREAGRWRLHSPQGNLLASYVVVATGHNHTPAVPDWPGIAGYRGELIHASRYCNATPYVGKDVLVVGSGNTGAEIALDLLETGAARVRVAIRTPPHIVGRQINGIPNPLVGILFRHLPPRIFDPVAARLRRLTFGDLAPYGLQLPPDGLYQRVLRDDAIPLIDIGFVEQVKRGAIEIVAAVAGFDGTAVLLADGARPEVDAVIAATGYRRGLESLVGHLGVLDATGRPSVRGAATDPRAPGLWFTGFTNPVSGMFRELGIDARRIARAVARAKRSSGRKAAA